MLGTLKRHEVEILLKAGHSKAEVARLARYLLRLDFIQLCEEYKVSPARLHSSQPRSQVQEIRTHPH